ncbi:MAG: HNH endonuclease [Aquisalimonadaceae bacterium]
MEHVDIELRQQAFSRIQHLERVYGDDIPWQAIEAGFIVDGRRILFASRAVGIFRPKQMRHGALSIKTVQPRAGRTNPYSDHELEKGAFYYSLQGDDPDNHHNRLLVESMEARTPLIYFHAVAPSRYKAIWPCYITDINRGGLHCYVAVGRPEYVASTAWSGIERRDLPDETERRYIVREVRTRLHQATFREMVLSAYGRRCAMSTLPVETLLDAAHIIPDSEAAGVASVNNGIALSRIHHGAYDADLIGIDADGRVHISDALMETMDGPLLETGLKALNGQRIRLPRNAAHHPDKDSLALRYERFCSSL